MISPVTVATLPITGLPSTAAPTVVADHGCAGFSPSVPPDSQPPSGAIWGCRTPPASLAIGFLAGFSSAALSATANPITPTNANTPFNLLDIRLSLVLLELSTAYASSGDALHQIQHFSPAFGADGEAIHAIQRKGKLQTFVGLGAQAAGAENLHADDAFAGGFHFAQHLDDHLRLGVHSHLMGIDTGQIDLHPGRARGGLQGF